MLQSPKSPPRTSPPRTSEDSKARIIDSAQRIFSQKGYARAGLREIAADAGVAGSLLVKYFSSKANLFEVALTKALIDPASFQSDRARFGQSIVESVNEPGMAVLAPAMIALSLGDDDAMKVILKVSREAILAPMSDWLGAPDAAARASFILMLTTGYAIFGRHLVMGDSEQARAATARMVADALQVAVDRD
jgi:AcrR family transcriptional regulator